MKNDVSNNANLLTDHFFRKEYGKMVAVISKYMGLEIAEDIVQEALLTAVDNWQQKGIPKNPEAWLYTTAKNIALNILKQKKHQKTYESEESNHIKELEQLKFSDNIISDEQLRMMFACCHPSISDNSQIALILKILCGFNITEIASCFHTTRETINKRLVRGRKQLRENNISIEDSGNINEKLSTVLKTIYLLFNEGYSPSQKNELIHFDFCLEAIRLAKILASNKSIEEKGDCFALIALMYFNASRFEARINPDNSVVDMKTQDRSKWDQTLINNGIAHLNLAMNSNNISKYFLLAAISANHCIAKTFNETNWSAILSLYDSLLDLENSSTIRLNRAVALAKVEGNKTAIKELKYLESRSDIGQHPMFHTLMSELLHAKDETHDKVKHLKKAISLTKNTRDIKFLEKKMMEIVPIPKSQL